jgi:hypothetical protein
MIKVNILEEDFKQVYGEDRIKTEVMGQGKATMGGGTASEENAIFDMLPQVIASKIGRIIPEGFRIQEIELEVGIAGKPFGIGVDGSAKVKLGPK